METMVCALLVAGMMYGLDSLCKVFDVDKKWQSGGR